MKESTDNELEHLTVIYLQGAIGSETQSRLNHKYKCRQMYNGNHLIVLLTDWRHTQTHTPRKKWSRLAFIGPSSRGGIGKLGVRVWSGTWSPHAVLPTRTCGAQSPLTGMGIPSSSAPTQPTMVGLEPTNQNPTSAARILQTTQPAMNDDRRPGEPSRPEARNDLQGTKEPPGYSS